MVAAPCPGPLIWFPAGPDDNAGAVLECAAAGCTYLVATGWWNDQAHAETPLLREGLASNQSPGGFHAAGPPAT